MIKRNPGVFNSTTPGNTKRSSKIYLFLFIANGFAGEKLASINVCENLLFYFFGKNHYSCGRPSYICLFTHLDICLRALSKIIDISSSFKFIAKKSYIKSISTYMTILIWANIIT